MEEVEAEEMELNYMRS